MNGLSEVVMLGQGRAGLYPEQGIQNPLPNTVQLLRLTTYSQADWVYCTEPIFDANNSSGKPKRITHAASNRFRLQGYYPYVSWRCLSTGDR